MYRSYVLFSLFLIMVFSSNVLSQGVSINTTGDAADTSAMLDVSSSSKGILIPRLTQGQRTSLVLPATGLIVYQKDFTTGIYYNSGTPASPVWVLIPGGSNQLRIGPNGVGINSSVEPTAPLEVYDAAGNKGLVVDANGISIGDIDGQAYNNKLVIDYNNNNYFQFQDGNVAIGSVTPNEKLEVSGNIQIPAANEYKYTTAKTKRYRINPGDMVSALSSVYTGRIDDGFSSLTVNGLNSLSAVGGVAGTPAYFIASVHLPDGAIITGLSAQLVKNGGSLQSVLELYRSSGSGYLFNTAQLIATVTTNFSNGGVVTLTASSINFSYNTIDNLNYAYFFRWSGEQATQNVRFSSATITYTVTKAD